MAQTKTVIEIPEFITVRELATLMNVSPINVIKELMSNGIMANINQQIDFDTASIVAEDMGYELVPVYVPAPEAAEDLTDRPAWRQVLAGEREGNLKPRPPVVTMLGHVDHGKTSLLDHIRQSKVALGEAGGITQHIGAYQASWNGQLITFLDTPGHEAFTAMRARGAKATDIAILVIAADDGIMPQTREAIDHARAARVAIIVALNKIDLPTANPNKVKQQLSEIGLVPDDWDGDTLVIPVSAKTGAGMEDLLEAILLTAEEIAPRANPNASPTGTVLEARMSKGRGAVTNVLVQNGTLRKGDTVIIGEHYGRIKSMHDFFGRPIDVAGPSTPVSISGLNGIPTAGDQFRVVKDEKEARRLLVEMQENKEEPVERPRRVSLDDFFASMQESDVKTLRLIIKADVQGSLEPIVNSLNKLQISDEVTLEILHASTGNITEKDVMLALASEAVILGFNSDVDAAARVAARAADVEINTYSIIYKLLEDVTKALKGLLPPTFEKVVIGRAEVRQVFDLKSGAIAGCYMRTGEARRNVKARVIRGGSLLCEGDVGSLRHHQENVRQIRTGFEFGVTIDGCDNFRSGDIIEFFELQRSS
ncbi:MAG: translation initiation factor IF-2 [Anaerolineae bacterium]|nr:translation initiation factor IF-2 [Anaerolineae bacterium]